ncbi:MAG: M20 family metallopeptidase [Pseudomonadota bacterium]
MAARADEILDGIRTWVEIESFSSDAAAVNRMMDRAEADWRGTGLDVARIPGRDGFGDHLMMTEPGADPNAKGVLVLCHLDTVHPIGTLAGDLPFRVDGDEAFGPGIYDMKGGAYLAFQAYREIAANGDAPRLPLRFLYTADEEVGSNTSVDLIEREGRRAAYVLVTEPARDGGQVVSARKGVGRYVIRAEGRPAHSGSRHGEGRSAIVEMAHQIQRIEGATDYDRGVTFNIGQINGGTAENVVPQHCEATIDMRIATVADGKHFDAWLRSLEAATPDVTVTVTGELNRPPYEKTEAGARLLGHARQLAAEIGFTLQDTYTGGASDGNFVADDVATLDGLGVDGEGAHTLEERCYISSFEPRKELLKRLMQTLQ